jgi:hypothetical protein
LEFTGQLSGYDPSYLESCPVAAAAWGVPDTPGLGKPCLILMPVKRLRNMECSFLDTAPRTG